MQKITFSSLLTLLISLSAFSQRLDYDHSSKWFFGINAGATWSCTDVRNENDGGWGFTLGKSYNWKTGRRISFDLRGRYLYGDWYGQDNDTSNLSAYVSGPLSPYKDTFNMTVHNFLNEQHRLAFELVLHANRFTERTNWDPYIFGGIGITWRKTWGNLYNDAVLYNYPDMLASGGISNAISTDMDNTYETPLNENQNDRWKAKWMPSLGIGIGYIVGPRFSIGIEHKTTFTGIDDWDGVVSSNRLKKDWYNYTSGYLQFRFRTQEKEPHQEEQNNINNINNYNINCIKPTISATETSVTTNTENYYIRFNTTEITAKNTIMIRDAGGLTVPFTFDPTTNSVSSRVVLKPGINRFTLFVQNDCGSATQTLEVNYNDCRLPNITFSNLVKGGSTTVQQSTLNLSAIIENTMASNIALYVNGVSRTQFSYNFLNDVFQSTLSLQPGKNLIKVEASNLCGSSFAATEIIYDNCVIPSLSMMSPSNSGTTVSSASQVVTVSTLGFSGKNEFSVLLNGQNMNNFSWANAVLTVPVTLVNGNNTLTVNGTNRCGSESLVISLNYQQCQAPVITLQNPASVNVSVSKAPYTVKFKTQNQSSISLLVNNLPVKNYTYNATTGMLEYSFLLTPGLNIVTLTSSSACGVDMETVNITYLTCTSPNASLTSSGGTVSASGYVFSATTNGINSIQEIKVTQNGNAIPFTFSSGIVQAISLLNPGTNTFTVTLTNLCGTQSQTQTVTYNNCLTPSVGLLQPIASGITVNQNAYELQFTTANVNNASEITLKVNGKATPFQWLNGIVSASVVLNADINNVVVSVKNACGSDSKSLQISFKQCLVPSVVMNSPNQLSTTTNQNSINIDVDAVNCNSAAQITVMRNGTAVPFSFTNGKITLNPTLTPGLNTFVIKATNDCGNDIGQLNVTYDNCLAPLISLNSPIFGATSNATLAISAALQNIANASQVILLVNGIGVPFTLTSGTLTASATLQAGNNTVVISATNSCGTDVETNNIVFNPCKAPTVTINQPVTSGSTVSNATFAFNATLENVSLSNQVILSLNGNAITNFQLVSGQLSATLSLNNGVNTIVLSANNGCGAAQQTTTLTLSTCNSPSVNIQTANGQTVSNTLFPFTAQVFQITNVQGLTFMVNGQITPISLVGNTATASVTLQNGQNTLMLSATNACGTDTKAIQVNFIPCTTPSISVQNTNNATVTSATYVLNATVTGVISAEVSITLNGNPVNNFTLNGSNLSATLTLSPGSNHVVLVAQNNCGFDRGDLNVIYENCTTPQINVGSMSDTVAQGILTYAASLTNMPSVQGIGLTLNGQSVSNYSYVNGVLIANLNLANGDNTIVLTANNACGNASNTQHVYYDHCQVPIITVTSALQASDGLYYFEATLQHVYDIEGVYFTFNGQNVPFNYNNGQFTATVTLNQGANTFYISAGNNCGTDTETTNVNFANCNLPIIVLVNPSSASSNVTVAAYTIALDVQNISSAAEVNLTQNGTALMGISLAGTSVTLPVALQSGMNTFQVNANNVCGVDQNSFTINYTPNGNSNNGGRPENNSGSQGSPNNNAEKQNPPKDVKPVTPAPAPAKKDPPKDVKPVTPAPAPAKKDPPKDVKPVTPAPAPAKKDPPKDVKPVTPAPAPAKKDPPNDVKPATPTPAPAKKDPPKDVKPVTPVTPEKPVIKPKPSQPEPKETKPEEKKPEKGGGK